MWSWIKKLFKKEPESQVQRNKFDFIAIDFETANHKKSSICSCGIVAVKDNKIMEELHFLVKPKDMYFNKHNVKIHGIEKRDVENQPEFHILWPKIKNYIDNGLVLAHNASFDISALRDVLKLYNLTFPNSDYICTVQMAKKAALGTDNCKLNTLAAHFEIPLDHHEALSDARACAQIAIKICELHQNKTMDQIVEKFKLKIKRI